MTELSAPLEGEAVVAWLRQVSPLSGALSSVMAPNTPPSAM